MQLRKFVYFLSEYFSFTKVNVLHLDGVVTNKHFPFQAKNVNF